MRHLSLALLFAMSCTAHAATYVVEPRHTQGVVRWTHLGFSHPTAQFARVKGTLVFDPAEPSKAAVRVTIPMAAFSSGVPDLDDDFHSASFFDIAKLPTATFASRKVERVGAKGHYRVIGDLVLHGVSRPVVLDATLNGIGKNARNGVPSIGFEATTTLKRSDFGVGRFVPAVSDAVDVHITLEAEEAVPFARYLRGEAARADNEADRKELETAAADVEAQAAQANPMRD